MSRNLQVFEITKSKWFGQVERYWDDWPVGEWMYRLVPFSSHGAFELKKIHLTESEFADEGRHGRDRRAPGRRDVAGAPDGTFGVRDLR